MNESPRCPECDGPIHYQRSTPCEKCGHAWKWLDRHQDPELRERWAALRDGLVAKLGTGAESNLGTLRIVAWQNGVLTLAGFDRERRWVARRYLEVIAAEAGTDKQPVLVGPRPGAAIARRILVEQRKESG